MTKKNRVYRWVAVLFAVALIAAACGDDSGGGSEAAAETTAAPTTTEAASTESLTSEELFADGDVQATLTWDNSNIDLYVLGAPRGDDGNRESVPNARPGDVTKDANSRPPGGQSVRVPPEDGGVNYFGDALGICGKPQPRMERIFWPAGEAPSGEYEVWIRNPPCDSPIEYTLEVMVLGEQVVSETGVIPANTANEEGTEPITFDVP